MAHLDHTYEIHNLRIVSHIYSIGICMHIYIYIDLYTYVYNINVKSFLFAARR